jgi:hypothetical protein
VPFALFELEEDRTYYQFRALAVLERSARYLDINWVKANARVVRTATEKHAPLLEALGACIYDAPKKRMPLMDVAEWYAEEAKGRRVVAIDPITAAAAGKDRYLADGDFMERCKSVSLETGSSLVLVTHPKAGQKGRVLGLDDLAGGTDYPRFAQTVMLLTKPKTGKEAVMCTSPFGRRLEVPNRVIHLLKVRNGTGERQDVAFQFDLDKGGFKELGVIVEDGA